MRQPERVVANRVIQFLTVYMLAHFLYLTYDVHSLNVVWFIVALLLGVLGYFRQLPTVLFITMIMIVLYGFVVMYQLWVSHTITSISWNDLFWMCMFPFTALVGGIHREDRLPKLQNKSIVHLNRILQEQDQPLSDKKIVLDDSLQFVSCNIMQFLTLLEDCIVECQRNQATFSLLLIQMSSFKPFENEYGEEQAEYLVNRTGSIINEVVPDVMLKTYMDDGLFAIVVPGNAKITSSMAQLRLDNRFRSMMLARSRSDGIVNIGLKYGSADFPIDGMDAELLLNQSLQELEFALKEVGI